MLPFTQEQFFAVFEHYNLSVWPMQVVLFSLALVMAGIGARPFNGSNPIIAFILAFMWLWMGVVYHWLFFTAINPAAYVFGALFVIQGVLFVYSGIVRQELSFRFTRGARAGFGAICLLYALFAYPVLGYFLGHRYPVSPTFGVPCPTTILTFGMLLWTDRRFPRYLLAIPLLWSLIGSTAAVLLAMTEDFGLLIAGGVGTTLILFQDQRSMKSTDKPT